MREMKESGISWLGIIPNHWRLLRSKYLFEQSTSKGNDRLVLQSATQDRGVVDKSTLDGVVQVSADADLSTFKTVHINDFVISLRSFQGGFEIAHNEGVISPAYTVFRMCCQKYPDYFKYLFKSHGFIDKINSLTVGIREGKNIQYKDFANMLLPAIEEKEQREIASFLDKKCSEIYFLISIQEDMIAKLQEYKQSVITEAVTRGLDPSATMKDSGIDWIGEIPEHWKIVPLLKSVWARGRLGWKGLKADEYVESGYPFLSAFNIIDNKLAWKDLNYINQERYDESPEIKLSVGDVLVVKDGAGIGKCARVDCLDIGEATVNSSLCVMTPNKRLNYRFLHYYFLSNTFQNLVLLLKNGMGVPHLTQENMKDITLPLAPVNEQSIIADFLDRKCSEIDALIDIKKQKIEALKKYKKSLVYECVTGKKEIN